MRVDPTGLEVWSAQCAAEAAKVASTAAGTTELPASQATAAAVGAGQTLAAAAAQVLSLRFHATAAKASAAAMGFVESDDSSAQALAEVAQGSVEV